MEPHTHTERRSSQSHPSLFRSVSFTVRTFRAWNMYIHIRELKRRTRGWKGKDSIEDDAVAMSLQWPQCLRVLFDVHSFKRSCGQCVVVSSCSRSAWFEATANYDNVRSCFARIVIVVWRYIRPLIDITTNKRYKKEKRGKKNLTFWNFIIRHSERAAIVRTCSEPLYIYIFLYDQCRCTTSFLHLLTSLSRSLFACYRF